MVEILSAGWREDVTGIFADRPGPLALKMGGSSVGRFQGL
jgi:hypothetical protein